MTTHGDFTLAMRAAGLSRDTAGALLGCQRTTIKRWCRGAQPVPAGAHADLLTIRAATIRAARHLAAQLDTQDTPAVVLYVDTYGLPGCEAQPMGPQWWEHVCALADLTTDRPVRAFLAGVDDVPATALTPHVLDGLGLPDLRGRQEP